MSIANPMRQSLNKSIRQAKGQTIVIISLATVALIGALSFGVDFAIMYFNWVLLQKAVDSAVLAGANYLPDNTSQAEQTARTYAANNGITSAEIQSVSFSDSNQSISMTLQRTVPYYFGRVVGLTNTPVRASATASVPYAPTTVNANTPGSVPAGGDNGGVNGGTCSGIGLCGLIPIGLDSHTAFTTGASITLQQGQLGPGNWDLLALGATGGANLRTNIANGYNSMVSVGDWLTTEPGKKVGPVDQGFQDRLSLAATKYSSGTFSSHSVSDPRVLVVPVVDWEHQNGRSQVQVTAFATLWLDGYNGGKVTVHFINQVIAHSFGSSSGPTTFGAHGSPFLKR